MLRTILALAVSAICIAPAARADVYTDTQDVYTIIDDALFDIFNPNPGWFSVSWEHDNPYPGDYEAALAAGEIDSVSLTIVADDVDLGDNIGIEIEDVDGNDHFLGFLEQMTFTSVFGVTPGAGGQDGHITTTTFSLDPTWLGGLYVESFVTTFRLFVPGNQAEIETATLAVVTNNDPPQPVLPTPTAMLLGLIGLPLVGRLRRRLAA